MTEPLRTTTQTPPKAITEPIQAVSLMESLNRTFPNIMVNIGALQIINDTFDANVILKAEFSAMKYKEPPVIPANDNIASSLQLTAHNLL